MDKASIIATITENKDNHHAIYERAIEAYRRAAIKRLNALIDALKAGDTPDLYFRLPLPEDHTKDYLVILDMLANSIDSYVELDETSFRRYVRDEWDWKDRFNATNSVYAVS